MVSKLGTIELAQLRLFVEVARRSGLTAAANHFEIPKSSVSKSLAALEASLGLRLVERSSRRVVLTAEGARLLPRAESILAEVDGMRDQAHEDRDRPEGLVRIAATPEFGGLCVARLLPGLIAAYPRLRFAIRLDYDAEDLLDLRADFAFRIGRVGDDRLVARRIASFSSVLVASPGFASRHPVSQPADLTGVDCLLFKDDAVTSDWDLVHQDHDGRVERVPVSGRVAVRGFTALLGAAEAGLGITRLPGFVAAPGLARGSVVRVLPEWRTPFLPVTTVHRVGIERIARVKAVLDHARREIPGILESHSSGL